MMNISYNLADKSTIRLHQYGSLHKLYQILIKQIFSYRTTSIIIQIKLWHDKNKHRYWLSGTKRACKAQKRMHH